MPIDFRFRTVQGTKDVGQALDVLYKPRIWVSNTRDYPDYFDTWLPKTETHLLSGAKRSLIVLSRQRPVATIIYQQHASLPYTVEIKNISVMPEAQGRRIASFMLRNMELEAMHQDFPDCTSITVDTKVNNTQMISFLLSQGYQLDRVTDLYTSSAVADAVFSKRIR